MKRRKIKRRVSYTKKSRRAGRVRFRKVPLKKKVMRRKRLITSASPILLKNAYTAGQASAEQISIEHQDPKVVVNEHWNGWRTALSKSIWPWSAYNDIAKQFVLGYESKLGQTGHNWLLTPTSKKVAVIVTVMNEEKTIPSVIQQLNRMPLHEIIIVINGTSDNSFYRVRQESKATILVYPEPLGHDVGRAIGAKIAQSDILLFLDGDFPIFAEHLIPFIYAVDQGKDVVLNNITPYLSYFDQQDAVTMMKEFLNRSLGRGDLRANSMTAIPHALSIRAVDSIGIANLAVPPKALSEAIYSGLSVTAPTSVDVISKNKQRNQLNTGGMSPVADMIIGDHLEALKSIMSKQGTRLYYQDLIRNRRLAGGDGY